MQDIRSAVLAANKAITKTPVAIYEMLALSAADGRFAATGYNSEVGITAMADYDGAPFQCCVPGAPFANIISACQNPELRFDNGKLFVKDGRSRFSVNTKPFAEHPGLPDHDGDVTTIPGDLGALLRVVAYASGKNDARAFLNSVCIESDGVSLSAVATDGHRLAAISQKAQVPAFQFLIPERVVPLLLLFTAERAEISNVLSLRSDDLIVTTKAVNAKFPMWRRLIPRNRPTFTVERVALDAALKTLNRIKENDNTSATLDWVDGSLKLAMRGGQAGTHGQKIDDAAYDFDCETYGAGEFAACIKYLQDMTSAVKAERISIEFDEDASHRHPLTVCDGDVTHLVMPRSI